MVPSDTRRPGGSRMRRGGSSFRTLALVSGVSAVVAAGIAALLVNIFQRQQEGRSPFFRVVELNENVDDPKVWGKNFPLQYDGYKQTVDMVRTRFGGSEAVPRTPSQADPRSI